LLGGFADDRGLKIAAAEIHAAGAESAPTAAAAQQRSARPLGFPLAFSDGEDFSRVDVHNPPVNRDNCFRILPADAAKSELTQSGSHAADIGRLGVVPELGDAADDDRVDAEEFSDLCRRCRVRTVAIGEVLFGQDLVQGLPFDDRVAAILHKIRDQQIGDAPANIDISTENR